MQFAKQNLQNCPYLARPVQERDRDARPGNVLLEVVVGVELLRAHRALALEDLPPHGDAPPAQARSRRHELAPGGPEAPKHSRLWATRSRLESPTLMHVSSRVGIAGSAENVCVQQPQINTKSYTLLDLRACKMNYNYATIMFRTSLFFSVPIVYYYLCKF